MRLGVLAVVVLATACGPSRALPDQVVEGRWVRYRYWADEGPPCAEAIEQIDQHVDALASQLDRRPPDGWRIDYYKLRYEHEMKEVRDLCRPHASACAAGTTIYTTKWADDHEVTHAFLSRIGQPPLFLAEGMAVVFGCGDARFVGDPFEPTEIEGLVSNQAWLQNFTWTDFETAGSLLRHLIDTYGMAAIVRLYEDTPYDVSRSDLEVRFQDATGGAVLSDAIAAWRKRPQPRSGEYCIVSDDRCDAPPDLTLAALGTGGRVEDEVRCVDTVRVLEIGADATYSRVRFTADSLGRTLSIRPCDASGSEGHTLDYAYANAGASGAMLGRWMELWTPLAPGRYSLTVSPTFENLFDVAEVAAPGGSASIEAFSATSPLAPACPASPVAVGDDLWTLSVHAPLSSVSPDGGVLHLQPQSPRELGALFAQSLGAEPQLCSGCPTAPDAMCQRIQPGLVTTVSIDGPSSIWVRPPPEGGSSSFRLLFEAP